MIFPSISKNKLGKAIKRILSWSILLTISSLHRDKNPHYNNNAFTYDLSLNDIIPKIIPLSAYILVIGIKELSLTKEVSLKHVLGVERVLHELMQKYNYIIPYPSPTFLVQYASYSLSRSYDKIYDNYSYFIHPYLNSIEYYPFLSIIEYKVLANELKKYSEAVK